MLPQVGSVVLAALPLRCIMRAIEAAMTKAPSAKVDIRPIRIFLAAAILPMTGSGKMKTIMSMKVLKAAWENQNDCNHG